MPARNRFHFVLAGAMSAFLFPLFAFAEDYRLLAPINSLTTVPTNNFAGYAQTLITLIIGLSAVLAVIMIMIGGFMWMGGESIGTKSKGKSFIQHAVGGLVLLLASYLILNTINPQLLNLNLSLPRLAAAPTTSGTQTQDPAVTQSNGNIGSLQGAVNSAACAAGNANCADATLVNAIMIAESGGNPNVGCRTVATTNGSQVVCGVMQVTVESAMQIACQNHDQNYCPGGPGTVGNSAAMQLALGNPDNQSTNIAYGTQILNNDLAYFTAHPPTCGAVTCINPITPEQAAIASYNGGHGAVAPSADCSGELKYQCNIDCVGSVCGPATNTFYKETLPYVNKVQSLKTQVGG